MDLTAYEKETIINYNEGEPTASVYTHNRAPAPYTGQAGPGAPGGLQD